MRGLLEYNRFRHDGIVRERPGIYKLRTSSTLITLLLIMLSVPLAADPTPYRAVYKATYKGVPISATGIRELTKTDDGHYLLTSVAKAIVATVEESTKFRAIDEQVRPVEYRYDRRGIGRKESDLLRFDWESMQVSRIADDNAWERDISRGIQDKLSYQQEMREELIKAKEASLPWPEMTYQVAEDDGRIREYRFHVVGEETVSVPAGTFHTIKAERVRDHSKRSTHFWLAPEHEFMLVRFEHQEDDGDGFKLLLREATLNGETVAGITDHR